MSIRSILIFRLLLASTILVGGGAIFSYQDVRHETNELFDFLKLGQQAAYIPSGGRFSPLL